MKTTKAAPDGVTRAPKKAPPVLEEYGTRQAKPSVPKPTPPDLRDLARTEPWVGYKQPPFMSSDRIKAMKDQMWDYKPYPNDQAAPVVGNVWILEIDNSKTPHRITIRLDHGTTSSVIPNVQWEQLRKSDGVRINNPSPPPSTPTVFLETEGVDNGVLPQADDPIISLSLIHI